MAAKRNALGNVYRLAWKHENQMVRLAALYLLTKGQVSVDDDMAHEEVIGALIESGCDWSTDHMDGRYLIVFTCDGAKECYENGAFFDCE